MTTTVARALAPSRASSRVASPWVAPPWIAPVWLAPVWLAPVWLVLWAALAPGAGAATLEVAVGNVRNDRGHVRVAVCPQALFLSDKCTLVGAVKARPGEVLVTLPDVPPGTYAAQSFHDENDNDDLDRTLFGLPKEGIGFSNDAPFRFGPPSFGDAAFRLTPAGGRIRFNLRYYD